MTRKYFVEKESKGKYVCHLDLYDEEGDWHSRLETHELSIDPPEFTIEVDVPNYEQMYLGSRTEIDDTEETLEWWVKDNIKEILVDNSLTEKIEIEYEF